MKTCNFCGQSKALDLFAVDKQARSGTKSYCKSCASEKSKEWRTRNRANARKHKCGQLRRDYGITLEQYEEMDQKQGGVCSICSSRPGSRRLSVDHCHSTGKVRGLLCSNCNTAIGLLGDNRAILQAAITYLEAHS
ncbi:endonuclease VII [Synechococcus phage S-CBS2]|uniref:endonuclease VII n=1 Tax=Synechococcus phage S-CBS2 TaxID=753084 RepID=UPI0002078418|nr:endonuclease VII [Synechococcus phage S-CBS2]ADF42419.1 endonuclease [Synechococcus phage S-CBS2]